MNRAYLFMITILLILVVELFLWQAFPNAARDLADNFSANAVAASKNDVLESNFELSFDPDSRFKNSGAASPRANVPAFDPVTMILFGSGLVGLAGTGIGRKR